MLRKILFLLATSTAVQSSELNNLIDASNNIVNQLDAGIRMVGTAQEYSYNGTGLSDGNLHQEVQISTEQLQAYNDALLGMQTYLPYGSIQDVLNEKANTELALMNDAIDVFTEVVIDMSTVVQVSEMAESAATPSEQEQVQTYVTENQEALQISQADVDTYNQSVADIENHANAASAYIAVSNNDAAVQFLQQGAENNNTTAEQATVSYNKNNQWVIASWAQTNNATAVYLNGNDSFGLDMYMSDVDILAAGSETQFYLTSPVAQGYDCFMYGECGEY